MRSHLPNAVWGVLDYAAYPAAMLLAAPMLIRYLGTAQYGVWAVSTALVSSGGILAAGFGDANIRRVAQLRMLGRPDAIIHAVGSLLAINLVLGSAVMIAGLILVPVITHHVVSADPHLYGECLASLRVACVLMLVRSVESVCISTQRAYERYGHAIAISLILRIAVVALACCVARSGYNVTGILIVTLVVTGGGVIAQLLHLQSLIAATTLWPSFNTSELRALSGFGIYSWIQALGTVLFTQADRVLAGVFLGASAVTAYSLCVQIAQPIYGLAAAGLHFLFPYLAFRTKDLSTLQLCRPILRSLAANVLFVLTATISILLVGQPFLRLWMGPQIARQAAELFVPVVWSFTLLGLSVTAYYALLALGKVRAVTFINLAGGGLMMLCIVRLTPSHGLMAMATARLVCGGFSLILYVPLFRLLRSSNHVPANLPASIVCEDR